MLLILLMFRDKLSIKRYWWVWLLPMLLAGAGFGVDSLVETEPEKIKAVIGALAKAVEEENCDSIAGIVSDDYQDSYHRTKKRLISRCKSRFSRPLVEKNIPRIRQLEISSPNATVICTMRILFDERSFIYRNYKNEVIVKIELQLQKEVDGWLIKRIEILEVDRLPAKWEYVNQYSFSGGGIKRYVLSP